MKTAAENTKKKKKRIRLLVREIIAPSVGDRGDNAKSPDGDDVMGTMKSGHEKKRTN